MSEIIFNQVVEGTTLVPMIKLPEGYGCHCVKCGNGGISQGFNPNGISMVYTKQALLDNKQKCRFCKVLERNNKNISEEHLSDIDLINKLLEREKRVNSGDFSEVREGALYIATEPTGYKEADKYMTRFKEKVGDLLVLGYIGEFKGITQYEIKYKKPKFIVLMCPICKTPVKVEYRQSVFKQSYKCVKNCKSTVEDRESSHNQKVSEKNKEIRVKEFEDLKKDGISMIKADSKKRLEDSEKYKALISKFTKKYTNHILADVDVVKTASGKRVHEVKLICKDCGSVMTVSSSERGKKKCDCQGSKFIRGRMKQSHVNSIHNGLIIIKQYDDFTCDAECLFCHNKIERVSLYDVITNKYCCSCYTIDYEYCQNPECGSPLNFRLQDILSDKRCKCPKCKSDFDTSEVILDIRNQDIKQTFRRLNSETDSKKLKVKSTTFVQDTEILYTGTNGVHYYKCMCMEHNKELILSADEIEDYNHEKCCGVRPMKLKRIRIEDLHNIRV